jgi:hypothetical protein
MIIANENINFAFLIFRIENRPKVECEVYFDEEYFKLLILSSKELDFKEATITYYKQIFVPGKAEVNKETAYYTHIRIPLEKFDRHVFERKYSAKICYSMTIAEQTIKVTDVYDFEVSH